MTKTVSITPSTKDFGSVDLKNTSSESFIVASTGTEIVQVNGLTSDNEVFTPATANDHLLPVSDTFYFDSDGNLSLSNESYGSIGTTDANGDLTVSNSLPTITSVTTTPTSPADGVDFTVSCSTTLPDGLTITFQSSSDGGSSWDSLGSGTVSSGSASDATANITSAGSYKIRAIYDVIESTAIDVVVASGSLKIQLDTINCDFTQVDAKGIDGTNYLVMVGYVTIPNYTALASIGGVTVAPANLGGSNDRTATVSICYDVSTKSVKWVKSHYYSSTLLDHYESQYTTNRQNIVDTDGTYVYYPYAVYNQNPFNVSFYIAKVKISDGTLTTSSTLQSYSMGSLVTGYVRLGFVILGSFGYVCYNDNPSLNSNTTLVNARKITLTDLTLGTETTIGNPADLPNTGLMTNAYDNFVGTDGTYLYWYGYSSTKNTTYRPIKVVRSDANIANFTNDILTITTLDTGSYGFEANSTKRFASNNNASHYVTDGTNNYTDQFSGKLRLAGAYLHATNGTNAWQLAPSDLTENWSKDYSADAVSVANSIVKVGTDYYLTGSTAGDFDGNHSGNTLEQPIIGKIDIDDGSIQ